MYLRDVATVEDTFKTRDAIVRVNGQEGISLVVVKLADANSISVVDARQAEDRRAQAAAAARHASRPGGRRLDATPPKSFTTVRNALIEAVLATGLILLLFLHTWRSTLIVLVSIPGLAAVARSR